MPLPRINFHILFTLLFICLTAQSVSAACYTDYKAKMDQPLRLHYGVMKLYESDCKEESQRDMENRVLIRLKIAGWQLLGVLETFDDSGLAKRKESAGQYYLRF